MSFEREGLQAMLQEVEAGRVATVITKDCCAIMGLNQKDLEIQGFDKDGSKKPVKSRLCGQQQAMRQLKLNKFTGQGYRFHQWYNFFEKVLDLM